MKDSLEDAVEFCVFHTFESSVEFEVREDYLVSTKDAFWILESSVNFDVGENHPV